MSNRNNNRPANNTNANSGATMANAMSDLFKAVEQTAELKIKTKTVNKTERDLLIKEIKAQIKKITVQRDILLENAKDDKLLKMQINAHAKQEILKIKLTNKDQLEALGINWEETFAGLFTVAGTAVGALIAPVSKSVGSFLGAMSDRAGIKMPWSK